MHRNHLCRFFLFGFCAFALIAGLIAASSPGKSRVPGQNLQFFPFAADPTPPQSPVKLIFIHHSTGEAWLGDEHGGLGIALRDNNYFVSDTNYGWGPEDSDAGEGTIGDHTDIGHWYSWFSGAHRETYTNALYAESGQNCGYSRLADDPGGPNQIIMFKSCFPNSQLGGNIGDPIPSISVNPLRGEGAGSEAHTVSNAKGIYIELLNYFASRQDKLFVVITAPPLVRGDTDSTAAGNARAFNNWLVNDWLKTYPYANVAVFDFYNVLTSNGGSTRTNDPDRNDLGFVDGNHHRWDNGAIQHLQTINNNFSAYASSTDDSHPRPAGDIKASGEFAAILNIAYNRWKAGAGSCTLNCAATVPASAMVNSSVSFAATVSISNCAGNATWDWDFGDGGTHASQQNANHAYARAGTYTWIMNVSAGGVVCSKSGTVTVAGGITLPSKATLLNPSGAIGTATPTYTWNAVSNSTWYFLWVNDSSGWGKTQRWYTAQEAGCAAGTGTCSVSSSVALAPGACQWWIQTWNDAGYGPWSDAMAFSVPGGGLPGKAVLVYPNGAITTSMPAFKWNGVSNATWYFLWVNDSSGTPRIQSWYPAANASCASGSGLCMVYSTPLMGTGAHTWWIQTWNESGYGPWSDAMSFSITR